MNNMKEKFPETCSMYQSGKLVDLFNLKPDWDPDFERHSMPEFNVNGIFKYLPHSIEFEGHRGDLSVSTVDIAYFSVGADLKHILVHHEPIPISGDIYDAFIAMVKWLKKNNLM